MEGELRREEPEGENEEREGGDGAGAERGLAEGSGTGELRGNADGEAPLRPPPPSADRQNEEVSLGRSHSHGLLESGRRMDGEATAAWNPREDDVGNEATLRNYIESIMAAGSGSARGVPEGRVNDSRASRRLSSRSASYDAVSVITPVDDATGPSTSVRGMAEGSVDCE